MSQSTYYNTNDEEGDTLAASRRAAQGQEDAILGYFRGHPESTRTRRNIELIFGFCTQSTARALRNLTEAGHLEKSEKADTRCEWAGKFVHTWRLARKKPVEQEVLF